MNQSRREYAISSAGFARAVEEPVVTTNDRWGASGGAAFAPPDVNAAALAPPDVK